MFNPNNGILSHLKSKLLHFTESSELHFFFAQVVGDKVRRSARISLQSSAPYTVPSRLSVSNSSWILSFEMQANFTVCKRPQKVKKERKMGKHK